tara:strand:+ start:1822 stop:2058 length:237 start_codon:yes stop_codon:yes gene_type:complete
MNYLFDLTPNEIQIEVNKLGYDMLAHKQENGFYKIEVWLGDEKCYGLGKIEYQCWIDGIDKTYKDFYKKFIINKQLTQ